MQLKHGGQLSGRLGGGLGIIELEELGERIEPIKSGESGEAVEWSESSESISDDRIECKEVPLPTPRRSSNSGLAVRRRRES